MKLTKDSLPNAVKRIGLLEANQKIILLMIAGSYILWGVSAVYFFNHIR